MKTRKLITIIIFAVMIVYGIFNLSKGKKLEEYNKLAAEYAMRGDDEKAIEYYQKIIDENPRISGAYLGIGIIYYSRGEDEKALTYCNQALTINPNIKYTKPYEFCNKISQKH